MKIVLAADHGGYERKNVIRDWLEEEGYQVEDLGTHSSESVDYPEYGRKAARRVQEGQADRGIIFCGSGIGIGIAANRLKGIRCANVYEPYSAQLSRQHNNANMISLGARIIGEDMTKEIIKVFLTTEFEGGRHQRRVDKLDDLEERGR
ncbi:MAG: ribose 5-phosphate isomerase B [Tissierellia bacterium]|nr:ribose 5-phosphate isomerase B [Tissierellia bacterium]